MASGSNAPQPIVSRVDGNVVIKCPHPGCSRTFAKQANYVSHSRTFRGACGALRVQPMAMPARVHASEARSLTGTVLPFSSHPSRTAPRRDAHGRDAVQLRHLRRAISLAIKSKSPLEVARAAPRAPVVGQPASASVARPRASPAATTVLRSSTVGSDYSARPAVISASASAARRGTGAACNGALASGHQSRAGAAHGVLSAGRGPATATATATNRIQSRRFSPWRAPDTAAPTSPQAGRSFVSRPRR